MTDFDKAIARLRSVGVRGMVSSDYKHVNDGLALYRQDLELILSKIPRAKHVSELENARETLMAMGYEPLSLDSLSDEDILEIYNSFNIKKAR